MTDFKTRFGNKVGFLFHEINLMNNKLGGKDMRTKTVVLLTACSFDLFFSMWSTSPTVTDQRKHQNAG